MLRRYRRLVRNLRAFLRALPFFGELMNELVDHVQMVSARVDFTRDITRINDAGLAARLHALTMLLVRAGHVDMDELTRVTEQVAADVDRALREAILTLAGKAELARVAEEMKQTQGREGARKGG